MGYYEINGCSNDVQISKEFEKRYKYKFVIFNGLESMFYDQPYNKKIREVKYGNEEGTI